MTARSMRSISTRTSLRLEHSDGEGILYDYRMLRPFSYFTVVLVCAAGAGAQTLIDNDQVRVLKVVDKPHVKTSPHDHKINRVMIYLNPGKQEVISGGKTSYLEYKAGQALWSPATATHTAEVVSPDPVTIVEVELKKQG